MSTRFALKALRALLMAMAMMAYGDAPFAADPPGSGWRDQPKVGSAVADPSPSTAAGAERLDGAPSYELRTRAPGRDHKGPLVPRVAHRKGLAVIADFSDTQLEDWNGAGISSVADLEDQLRLMEEHWAWLSRGLESFRWDIVRITLPVELGPRAYPDWIAYRDAVATLVRQQVDVSRYDANHDGIIDTVWVVASNNGFDFDYMGGGSSQNAGANMFVDGQNSLSVVVGATGNFNHETGHTIGLPDLYGPYGTISYLSVMADSWPVPPNDFTAYERMLLGWVKPQVVSRTRRQIRLSPPDDRMQAVRVPGSRTSEYFLIEYRRRPESGFGSTAPVPYDGLAVYHVLEGSNQGVDPPLVKLEPADGSIAPDTAPEQTDFFSPDDPGARTPAVLRSYFGDQDVFRLANLRRTQNGDLMFDIEVAPQGSQSNLLANSSFEAGSGGLPDAWQSDSWQPSTVFDLESGIAKEGRRSVSISAPTPNDARWVQMVSGLTPGQSYALCGWLRGKNIITTPDATVGANVSVMGGFVRSEGRSGTFDWAESCVVFKPEESDVLAACRLGFYGSTVIGKVWCDMMTFEAVSSAF